MGRIGCSGVGASTRKRISLDHFNDRSKDMVCFQHESSTHPPESSARKGCGGNHRTIWAPYTIHPDAFFASGKTSLRTPHRRKPGGLFHFILLATPNYPHEPPLARFMTTGQQQVRFNPQFYTSGASSACVRLRWCSFLEQRRVRKPWGERPNWFFAFRAARVTR